MTAAVISLGAGPGFFGAQEQTELGVGNRLLVAETQLRENTRAVQLRNDVDVTVSWGECC